LFLSLETSGLLTNLINADSETTTGTGTKNMRTCLEESLKKLQTHYVDLFYLHFWDYTTSIPELMHSLNDLVTAGKVNYLGISDTPAWVVTKVRPALPHTNIKLIS
jgi:aryl-alcohol dehydrogenase-like predicted oxidoreductase